MSQVIKTNEYNNGIFGYKICLEGHFVKKVFGLKKNNKNKKGYKVALEDTGCDTDSVAIIRAWNPSLYPEMSYE